MEGHKMDRHKSLIKVYYSRKENNMSNKLQDDDGRTPKFRKAELQVCASLAGYCSSYSSPPAGGRMGGVVLQINEK
jgi:hypothetical protein